MRDVLRKRFRELTERFADDLAGLVADRIEADIAHIGEILEYSLSAIASDLGAPPLAEPDLVTAALGPELAGMLTPAPAKRERDYKPENYPPSRRDREERAVPQANGKKPVTCSKCGYVGGNARGCGTAHETRSDPKKPLEIDVDRFLGRPAPTVSGKEGSSHGAAGPVRSAATPDRRAAIAARATKPPAPRPQAGERAADEPDIFEDDEPLADRIARAEASKREGELPRPRSTFDLEHTGGKYADVRELDFGGDTAP